MANRKIIESGTKFDKSLLTVIEVHSSDGNAIWYLCKCECGKTVVVRGNNLRSSHTKSCGCLRGHDDLAHAREKNIVSGTSLHRIMSDKLQCNNTSGVTGVSWDKSKKKWRAEIMFKGVFYRLGKFACKEDAIKARKEAEEKTHGEFIKWYNENIKT